jgi:tRNA pseudouridine55 synthase
VTDTWDRTGAPQQTAGGPLPPADQVERALAGFLGVHSQLPPPYSAKMVDGVRAHVLARRGNEVAVRAATVTLHECAVEAAEGPLVRVRLRTSAGYYVRSLVHEVGQALGCGACLEQLRRSASGDFDEASASGLAWLEQHPEDAARRIFPLESLLPELPGVVLDEANAVRAGHGNEIAVAAAGPGFVGEGGCDVRLLSPDGRLLAIARQTGRPGLLHPAVVLK